MFHEPFGAGVQSVADVVPIEEETVYAQLMELVIDHVGHRTLAATAQSRKPHDAASMAVQGRALLSADLMLMPGDVDFVAHVMDFPLVVNDQGTILTVYRRSNHVHFAVWTICPMCPIFPESQVDRVANRLPRRQANRYKRRSCESSRVPASGSEGIFP
jgi:hypothetical protein